jgi:KDO2-lipid IV(A) lauroyltransferase
MSEHGDPLLLRVLYRLTGVLVWLAFRVLGLRRTVIRRNLERSFPDWPRQRLQATERDFVRRHGEQLAELLYTPYLTADELRARVAIADRAPIADAGPGNAVILDGSHNNNFEWALQRMALEFSGTMVGLYKPQRNARLDAWLRATRQRFGARLVPAKTVLRVLARDRNFAAVGIVADQAPTTSRQRHWTIFLGQETAFYLGPELLRRPLRAQVLYVRIRRLSRGRYEISLDPLHQRGETLPPGEITERYARALERDVRDDPAGWWWNHRRWKLKRQA